MDFSDPFTGMGAERPLNPVDTAAALRLDAAAELDATNLYQAHIDAITDPEIRRVIESIRDDEKQHLAEFIAAIKRLDPVQDHELNSHGATRVMATIDGTDIDARLQALDARIRALDNQLFGRTVALPENIPAQEYFERRRRGDETAYTEQLERERATQQAFNEALRREIAERERERVGSTTYPCSLPGESVADWVSGITGSPGIEYQPEAATTEPCIRLNLGEGHKPLVFAKGIIGALDEEQIHRYCTKGFIDREASEKQKERIRIMSQAAKTCHTETQGIEGTPEHLTRYFACLGRELKKKGVEL
jgi:rubrerythrin